MINQNQQLGVHGGDFGQGLSLGLDHVHGAVKFSLSTRVKTQVFNMTVNEPISTKDIH